MRASSRLLAILLLPIVVLPPSARAADGPPVAPVRPVTDTYFGTQVVDDYRWLEDLRNPEVQAWMKAQAAYAKGVLEAIPGREQLLTRIHELNASDTRRFGFTRRGQRIFYEVIEPGAEQPKLVYRDGLAGAEQLLLDPATLGKGTETHYALDWYEPSWDGKTIAYGLSAGGSEASTLHVMDVASGKVGEERIPRTDSSVVTWRPDNRSFFYMRFPKVTPDMPPSEQAFNARTYLHVVGKNADGEADPVVFGRGVGKLQVPEGQGTWVVGSPESPWVVAVANHNIDNNPSTFYVARLAQVNGPATPWKKFADVPDGVSDIALRGDTLYFLSRKGASRFRILATSLAKPEVGKARVIVPESKGIVTNFGLAQDGLYYRVRDGSDSKIVRVGFDGKDPRTVPMPIEGNAFGPIVDATQAGTMLSLTSWTSPARVYAYDPTSNRTTDTGLAPPSKIDVSQLESKEVLATSYDGTQVPLSIVYRKGLKLDGSAPVFLQGYGAYGVVNESGFWPASVAWLEKGGIYAIAHVRGGGEYGEDWHTGGQKLTKLNTVYDFIACAEYLVREKYTTPQRIAANGGSAGGITVGRAMTLRPDLFGVVLDQVGMSDTLRTETEPNGPPNVVEFGSTKVEDGFRGLYAMSPYIHVTAGTAYPAVIYATGANDPRVAPWHMMKMAAKTHAATTSGKPVLLRIDYDAGHGIGSNRSQRERELADLWGFSLQWMNNPDARRPCRSQC